jgi:hypothetical protein
MVDPDRASHCETIIVGGAMSPRRRAPTIGARVTVAFLARRVGGSIEEIDADGRRLLVVTDEGEPIRFELSQATGSFVQEGPTGGAKLAFEDEAPG